jgi:hypothetical protein
MSIALILICPHCPVTRWGLCRLGLKSDHWLAAELRPRYPGSRRHSVTPLSFRIQQINPELHPHQADEWRTSRPRSAWCQKVPEADAAKFVHKSADLLFAVGTLVTERAVRNRRRAAAARPCQESAAGERPRAPSFSAGRVVPRPDSNQHDLADFEFIGSAGAGKQHQGATRGRWLHDWRVVHVHSRPVSVGFVTHRPLQH